MVRRATISKAMARRDRNIAVWVVKLGGKYVVLYLPDQYTEMACIQTYKSQIQLDGQACHNFYGNGSTWQKHCCLGRKAWRKICCLVYPRRAVLMTFRVASNDSLRMQARENTHSRRPSPLYTHKDTKSKQAQPNNLVHHTVTAFCSSSPDTHNDIVNITFHFEI